MRRLRRRLPTRNGSGARPAYRTGSSPTPLEQLALWKIREEGAGLAARSLSRPAQAGWEDAAVPPEKLGAYLRDFDDLLRQSALDGVPYGHFGDGCVHVRIDFELGDSGGRGRFREFVEQAADLVASYGGSMSGEHGDGRARSELLPRMYSPQALALMQQAKRILDPTEPAQPRCAGRSGPVGLRPPAGNPSSRAADDAAAEPRQRLLPRSRAPLHRRREVHRGQHWFGRGDVPVLSRHPGGEGLHPRSLARAPGRRHRGARSRRPGGHRCTRPVPVLQGLRQRLPDRCRHGHLQVRGALPAVRRSTRLPAAAAIALRAGPAPALGPDDPTPPGQRDAPQQDRGSDRQGCCRGRPATEPPTLLRETAALWCHPSGRERRRLDLGRLLHRPVRRRHRPGRDRAARVDGPAGGGHPRTGLLRSDLDHHRPALGGAPHRRQRRRDAARLRQLGGSRSSGSNRAALQPSARTPPSSWTIRGPPP